MCERDAIAPPQPTIKVAERAPHGFHKPWFDRVVDDQIALLRRKLLEPTATGGE